MDSYCNKVTRNVYLEQFDAKLQGYSLIFSPKIGHIHVEIYCKKITLMLKLGHFYAKLQGYSLTFFPKISHILLEILFNKIAGKLICIESWISGKTVNFWSPVAFGLDRYNCEKWSPASSSKDTGELC